MAGDRVVGVLLTGHAACEYLPDPRAAKRRGGRSRLTGDLIRVWLKEGTLQRAAAERGVVGTYWMTEEERGRENAK